MHISIVDGVHFILFYLLLLRFFKCNIFYELELFYFIK